MSSIDLGEYTPDAATGVQRSPSGALSQPRALTTFEQEAGVTTWMLRYVGEQQNPSIDSAHVLVTWGDRHSSVVEIGIRWETTPEGNRIPTLAWRRELDDVTMDEIPRRGSEWVAQVRAELRGRAKA